MTTELPKVETMTDAEINREVHDHRITLESIRPYRCREVSNRLAVCVAELVRREAKAIARTDSAYDALIQSTRLEGAL